MVLLLLAFSIISTIFLNLFIEYFKHLLALLEHTSVFGFKSYVPNAVEQYLNLFL